MIIALQSGQSLAYFSKQVVRLRWVCSLKDKAAGLLLIIALLLFPALTEAQELCTGSLGDPIVNITFGSGSSPRGPALSPDITNYTYTGSTALYDIADGYYTIASSTSGMNQHWFTTDDHTPGDVNGYMMVINASETPGDFYKIRVDGLCPGTKYEFAAWVMNLLTGYDGLKPNITFTITTIDGKPVRQYQTGDIPQHSSATWVQYGFFFETPANTSSVLLTMSNNGPGGQGNDLALDDITFRPCGPDIVVSASLPDSPKNIQYCEGDDIDLNLSADISSGFQSPVTMWQMYQNGSWTDIPGDINSVHLPVIKNASPGNYSYRLTVGEAASFSSEKCRVNSNVFTITVNPKPVITVSNNGPACYGDNLTLSATGGDSYQWTGPDGFSSSLASPVIQGITAAGSGTYYVTVTSPGCKTIGQTNVVVNPPPSVDAGNDVSICAGTSTILHAVGGDSYRWVPSRGLSDASIADPVASPSETTTYTVYGSSDGCTATDAVTVTVRKSPSASAGPDKKAIEGQPVKLEGVVNDAPGLTYFWTPSDYLDDPSKLQPLANPPSDIVYTLHALSDNGCSESVDDVSVKVLKKPFIPNTFSPNGDGNNDVWNISSIESYPLSDVKVFNRFGTIVFSETGYAMPWNGKFNGKDLPEGVYYYIISLKPGNMIYKGWVLIAR